MHYNSDCSVCKILETALYPSQNYCLLFFPNCITLVGLSVTEISKGELEMFGFPICWRSCFKVPIGCFSAVADQTALIRNLRADVNLWCLSCPLCPHPRGVLRPPCRAGGRDELALGQIGLPEAAVLPRLSAAKGLGWQIPVLVPQCPQPQWLQQATYPCSHFFISKDKDTTGSLVIKCKMAEPRKNGACSVCAFR